MRLSELGEDELIERFLERLPPAGPQVRLGIGDDAAAVELAAGEAALLSVDALVEGVHFTRKTLPPAMRGRKALAVGTSDIAAMGGRPVAALLGLAAPADTEVDELLETVGGLVARAAELGLDLVGGNLSDSPGPVVLDVTVVGETHGGRLLRRTGARPGDGVYVSGRLGASAEGLALLEDGMVPSASGALLVPAALRDGPLPLAEECIRRHMDPDARVGLGRFLAETDVVTACIDLSDGLERDLLRLCRASGVGARLREEALPIHPGVLAWERVRRRSALDLALGGGEDYELLFTAAKEEPLDAWRAKSDLPLTRIGTIEDAAVGVRLVLRDGTERVLGAGGWAHFARPRGGR